MKGNPPPRPDREHPDTDSMVHDPAHYELFVDLTVIEVIARSMTVAEFRGFCKGNVMKYQLRVGKKGTGTVYQDLAKAENYRTIYNKFMPQCMDANSER